MPACPAQPGCTGGGSNGGDCQAKGCGGSSSGPAGMYGVDDPETGEGVVG